MKFAATANHKERQEELGQILAASPVADFMDSMFGPLTRTARLLDTDASAFTADSSLCGYARNCQADCMQRDNPRLKPIK